MAIAGLLANLIDNAINYGPNNGRVTCRCGLDNNNQPFIEVEDNGPGISVSIRKKIFDRFYRVQSYGKAGTGLRLAIVKEVAERHSANVIITTPISKEGTCFRVLFPSHD